MDGEDGPARLPTGTVTFLFTDIEGSTGRWQAHPERMQQCVEQLDTLLRRAIDDADGHVVKQLDDRLMAVFDDAHRATVAAVAAQRAISSADWGPVPAIRVRMGLHTGSAAPVAGDYVGDVVNRAARIAESANGGQIVTSVATAALVAGDPGLTLRSLGFHELKDLASAIEIVQVEADGLERDFPMVRSIEVVAHDLPAQRTSFVGRRLELGYVAEALRSSRLVTIVGIGGVGKTRLALQAAAESAPSFVEGVRFVELAGVNRTDDVASALLDHLPGAEVPVGASDPVDALVRRLQGEQLLVVDNCEHRLEDCARVIGVLLDSCPALTVLATSRTRLALAGEHVVALQPLAVEDPVDVNNDAIRLFVERAQAAGVLVHDLDAVARICGLVDGLPLAIELAAARTPHLAVAGIAERLERHTRLLVSRRHDASERHRSLETMLDWSYELLDPIERELFGRLGVFVGPVDIDQITGVITGHGIEEADLLDLLAALVDRSLVVVDADSLPTRYSMLGVVRRFAARRLADDDRLDLWRDRHARWCLRSVTAGLDLPEPDEQLRDFMRRSGEELTGALDWAVSSGRFELAWELTGASWRWWEMRGRAHEGLERFAPVVDGPEPSDSANWAGAMEGVANLAFAVGDLEQSIERHEQAIRVFDRHGLLQRSAWCRTGLSMAELLAGASSARATAQQAFDHFARVGDVRGMGHARAALAMIDARRGDLAAAEAHYLEALSVFRLAGHRRDAASVLSNLANLAQDRTEWRRATRFYDGALQLYREINDRRGVALILNNLAIVAQGRGDLVRAEAFAQEARSTFQLIGDRAGEAACLNNLANLAAERNDAAAALGLCREAIETFKSCADARGVVTGLRNAAALAEAWELHRMAWTWHIDAISLLTRLGMHRDAQADLAALEALAMRHDSACAAEVQRARAEPDSASLLVLLDRIRDRGPTDQRQLRPSPDAPDLDELTGRERELLDLVGQGLTNGEIAERLFISPRTVDAHLSHIRAKLGITARSKLVVAARNAGSTETG